MAADRSADTGQHASDGTGAPGELLAIIKWHRRAADHLRPVEHTGLGGWQRGNADSFPRQRHTGLEAGSGGGGLYQPSLEGEFARHWPVSRQQLLGRIADQVSFRQLHRSHGLPDYRQATGIRPLQHVSDAHHNVESNRIGLLRFRSRQPAGCQIDFGRYDLHAEPSNGAQHTR